MQPDGIPYTTLFAGARTGVSPHARSSPEDGVFGFEMQEAIQLNESGVRGWLHSPVGAPRAATALTHGAGSNCGAPLLVALAQALAGAGHCVLRYDLPFRQARPKGPPRGSPQKDRDGIRAAAAALRRAAPGVPLYLSGHSYGGRQTSILAAEEPEIAAALLLLSYPLHAPGQPGKLRVDHFPSLRMPVLFAHGTRDNFGSPEEMEAARRLIPSRTELRLVEGAGHGLPVPAAGQVAEWFTAFAVRDDG